VFGWRTLLGVEIDWPENPKNIILIENARNHESPGVCMENVWLGWIEMLEDWGLGEGPFPFPERHCGLPRPFLLDLPSIFSLLASRFAFRWVSNHICVLLKFCKRKSNLGIFPDEPSLEVHESEEHPDMLN
jgi:hypothetical protein